MNQATARYNPWWLPTALVVLLLTCLSLAALLVMERAQRSSPTSFPVSSDKSRQAPQYTWRLVTSWPKKFPGLGMAPERFAEHVSAMSRGRLKIDVYGANEIVPALGVFDAVSSGSVEMGHSAAYYWKGKISAGVFFTSVPFGMNAQELNAWLHYGGGLEVWRELYAPFNLIPFAGGNTGVQMGGWFNTEIRALDDIKNLKMRIPGFGGEVFTRAGGTAVNIPGGELYTALQSGVIDATEWVGPYNDQAFGFQNIAQFYYYPGWHEPGAGLEFTVNKDAFSALPSDLQAIIEVAARAVNQDMLDEYTHSNSRALTELTNNYSVTPQKFPQDVLDNLQTITHTLFKEKSRTDDAFDKVHKAYQEYFSSVRRYHDISEKQYYESR